MKKIFKIILLTKILLTISFSLMATEKYMFTERGDFIPKETNKIVKKNIKIRPNIKSEFYFYRKSGVGNDNMFIIFHGGINSAQEFMQNTNLHRRIINSNGDFMLFSSYGDNNWGKNKKENKKIVKSVLGEMHLGFYKNVFLMGYAEGGTFATEIYCNNNDMRAFSSIDHIWNINGTMIKDCHIPDRVSYNLFYGSDMDITYYSEDYYNNYEEIVKQLANRKECSIEDNLVEHGSRFDEVYLERYSFSCDEENRSNIFKAINMERNFPYTNKLEYEGFVGNELNNFDFMNFIKRIHYF